MIPEEIFIVGDMLGLEHKDLQDLIPEKSSQIKPNNMNAPSFPLDNYKVEGGYYGTISINDF